ncbi:MAG: substrate-binding protein [Acidovorax temperans]|uniref:substrate-binding protein n=1 Tax=Acidovorax temperans TaxID=80878 RepID=UPI00391B23FE
MKDQELQHSDSQAANGALMQRRHVLKTGASALVGATTGFPVFAQAKNKVKIGFHTALTGLETLLGEAQLNCFKLAVEEINAAGGAGGREIEYLVEDNQTSTRGAIDKTRKFIGTDKVDVIIGMITSLERAAALSVSVPAKKLVIYPTYYEGGECQRYLACTGQIPNQSIDPFAPWIMQNVGKTVYILGSDYAWPKKTAEAISAAFEKSGGKVVKAEFFPFGTQDFGPALDRIRAAKPDVVWELFAGNDAVSFIKQFASYKPGGQLLTNGLDELFTTSVEGSSVEGIIVNQSYFSTLPSKTNTAFLERYRKRFGKEKHVNAIAEATYNAVWVYAKAVQAAGSTDTEKVINALGSVSLEAPQGAIRMDPSNNHMHTNSIIGRCRKDGMFDIVKNFGAIKPEVPSCNLPKA